MNLVLLDPVECARGAALGAGAAPFAVRLEGRRARHILEVHRAVVGSVLRVGVVGGRVGKGRVTVLDGDAVELEVSLDADPPPALPCTLVLALPRPKVLRRVLAAAASFGIKRIFLFGARRVEKSYWQSPLASEESVRAELLAGLEQARDTVLPVVERRPLFRPFVEDELASIAAGSRLLVAHPSVDSACPRALDTPFTLVIGPEGGFVDFELSLLRAAGAETVSLGPRPLRVEHAVAFLVGRLAGDP